MKISVLGAGAWGTAIAMAAATQHAVCLWARNEAHARDITAARHNLRYLPEVTLPSQLAIVASLPVALSHVAVDGLLIIATPMSGLRAMLQALPAGQSAVWLCKGFEAGSGLLGHELARRIRPDLACAVLSGPSFALEVARAQPTALVAASERADLASVIVGALHSDNLRIYTSSDIVGVEVGGALKNVFAIAAGAVVGAGLGASAQAAMVTRGFVELRRIARAFGARPETLMGLSGLGDLMLTCGSSQSRNFAYGVAVGRGDPRDGLPLAEGVATAGIAARIAVERGIEAPIIAAVDLLLGGTITVREAVAGLMTRPLRSEDEQF